jgi:hypothetical protein
MDTLPIEIIDLILICLDIKDILSFSESCKRYNHYIVKSIIWKYKCLNDYNIYKLSHNFKKNNTFYNIYKHVYLKQCIHCHANTSNIEMFYRKRVCNTCQKNIIKYHKISYTSAKKTYFLKNHHLENIEHLCLIRNNTKWYLERDMINYVYTKVYTEQEFLELRRLRENKYIRDTIMKINKFMIVRTYIYHLFDIDIINYVRYINRYSDKLYSKYLSRKKTNRQMFQEIVYNFIEIFYLDRARDLSNQYNHSMFESILLDDMLTELSPDINIPYITAWKEYILIKYSDLFIRRDEIKNQLKDVTSWSFQDYSVREYLYGNDERSIHEIKNDYIELHFFRTHTNIHFFDNFLFKKEIPSLLNRGISIPQWIIDRHK